LGCGGAGATHSAFGEAETLLDRGGQLADAAAVAGRQAARKAPVIAVNNKDKALRVRGRILSRPPTSQTVQLMLLYLITKRQQKKLDRAEFL
jgi:hypothetical protein